MYTNSKDREKELETRIEEIFKKLESHTPSTNFKISSPADVPNQEFKLKIPCIKTSTLDWQQCSHGNQKDHGYVLLQVTHVLNMNLKYFYIAELWQI